MFILVGEEDALLFLIKNWVLIALLNPACQKWYDDRSFNRLFPAFMFSLVFLEVILKSFTWSLTLTIPFADIYGMLLTLNFINEENGLALEEGSH